MAIAEDDPKENNTPKKTVTPWKTFESEPGKYGNITTNIKAYIKKRIILKVGIAQSG
ncbi:hypothetical protein D3C80_1261860 [compost metagenome]